MGRLLECFTAVSPRAGGMKAFWLIVFLALSLRPGVGAIEQRCSACQAVAAELRARLDAERPRNHLDMRHRLDKDGKRYGKVIAYKVSELRAVELLEDLCEDMSSDYTLMHMPQPVLQPEEQQEGGAVEGPVLKQWEWVKFRGVGAKTVSSPPEDERKALSRELESYCGIMIEKHEDEVMHALQEDMFGQSGVAPLLCGQISKHCPAGTQYREQPPTPPASEEGPKVEL